MRAVVWLRVSAVLFFLFALGHTIGFLSFRPATAEGRAVWTAMNSVHFSDSHASYSYGEFYMGFGLFITLFYLFSAWLAWRLGSMARRGAADARAIAWGLCAVQVVGLGLSVRYFSVGPAVLSGISAACLGFAGMSMRADRVE